MLRYIPPPLSCMHGVPLALEIIMKKKKTMHALNPRPPHLSKHAPNRNMTINEAAPSSTLNQALEPHGDPLFHHLHCGLPVAQEEASLLPARRALPWILLLLQFAKNKTGVYSRRRTDVGGHGGEIYPAGHRSTPRKARRCLLTYLKWAKDTKFTFRLQTPTRGFLLRTFCGPRLPQPSSPG